MNRAVWVVAIVVAFSAGGASAAEGVAARVNGTPISAGAVQRLAEKIAASGGVQVDQVWNDARDQLVSLEALAQVARSEKIDVSAEELASEMEEIKTQLGGQTGFQKHLTDSKSTEPEFREETRRSLLVQKLIDRHVQVNVSDADIAAYYKENQDEFERPEMVRASHILIKIPAGGDAEAARKRATDVLSRAKGGEDFAKLARELSEDTRTKENGGDLGFFPNRPTPVAEAAFKLQSGQISDVVQSPYGLHIIKVVARRPAGTAPLSEVKEDIRSMLEDDARDEKEEEYINAVQKRAKIEILMDKKSAPSSAAKGKAPH